MTLTASDNTDHTTAEVIHPCAMTALQAAAAIRAGELSAEQLVRACLDTIEAREAQVQAWHFLEPAYALAQAREADRRRSSGHPVGPLHGIPVGIKDIFDTSDMPTEDGTPLHRGRTPACDATAVARLRQAGAIIMGKTVTTELAVYSPGRTRNPHDTTRTPGGSSSGSAAAVAAGMLPLAIGTQTNGSIIRPAAYCGVYGYKPSHGLISRYRVLTLSRRLDHVGVFGRSVEDVALIAEQMMGYDEHDPDTAPSATPALLAIASEPPPTPPRLAFVRTSAWERADSDVHLGFRELRDFLGDHVVEVELPALFNQVYDWHRCIMEADLALNLRREYERGREALSPELQQMIERGRQISAVDYNLALQAIPTLTDILGEILLEYDAIITPAVTGEAPVGLDSTGSPVFCTPWSLCGVPAISLPLLEGSSGMPVGVQLVASTGDDARLLRTARWLAEVTSEPQSAGHSQEQEPS
jgi:Asp-tRNA(Asn)/Glu-tRNA(Gln) amidotransferase A subunit family amidase